MKCVGFQATCLHIFAKLGQKNVRRMVKLRPHQTPCGAAPRCAEKKLVGAAQKTLLFIIAGATLQAAPRRAAPENESWEKFIFHGAAFSGVALWPITLTRSLSSFNARRGAAFGGPHLKMNKMTLPSRHRLDIRANLQNV